MAFIYDLTDTWNASGTTFNAIKMNVTDTASAAGSRLLTLQVGGAERFSVDKAGNVLIGNGGDLQISSATGGNNSTFYNDAQDLYITTNGTARMYINSSGNVGVGNTSPGTKLDVTGNIRLSAASPVIEWNSGGAQVYAPAANSLAIATGGGIGSPVERMRITSAGNVGIGTSSPNASISTLGGFATLEAASFNRGAMGSGIKVTLSSASYSVLATDKPLGLGTTGAFEVLLSTNNAERMRIDSSGQVGIGTTSPFNRLSVVGPSEFSLGITARTSSAQTSLLNHPVMVLQNSSDAAGNGLGLRYQIADTGSVLRTTGGVGMVATAKDASSVTADMYFYTGTSERVRITSAGNVGIGTSAPANRLAVQDNTAPTFFDTTLDNTAFLMCNRGAGDGNFGASLGFSRLDSTSRVNAAIAIKQTSADADQCGMSFFTHASAATGAALQESMTITHAGNVGIGTSAPTRKVTIFNNDATNNTSVPTLSLHSDRNDRGVSLDVVRGALSSVIGLAISTSDGADPVERMRISPNGNVGIGTSSPNVALEVNGNIHVSGVDRSILNRSNSTFRLGTNNTEYIFIQGNGDTRFFQNTTSDPGISNTTVGAGFGANGRLALSRSGGAGFFVNRNTSDGAVASFRREGLEVGTISVTTTAAAYNTSSDYRLKDINGPIQNSGAYIDALKPVQGSWKADGSRFIGLLAHEVQEVSETQIATGEKDGEEMQAMNYSAPEIIANLIAEVQSLRSRVAQLEGN